MKIFLFLFLNLLAIPRSFGENICQDVTFDECNLEEGRPTDTLFTVDSIMCQDICQSFTNCNFFRFNRTATQPDNNCQFFEANYRDSCNIVAAPIDRDVNECLSNTDNTCDKMIEETCQYSGNVIYDATPGTITDAADCGDLCIDFEQLECRYWKFDKNNETCTLYDSDDRSCNILSGPEEPSIESCEGTTTAMEATTTPFSCPKTTNSSGGGWLMLEGTCYIFDHQEYGDKDDARTFCEDMGGMLVEINSKHESDLLYSNRHAIGIHSTAYLFWIGLTADSYGDFDTWDSSTPVDWKNWSSGEPTGSGDCVDAFYHDNLVWCDADCSWDRYALCEAS